MLEPTLRNRHYRLLGPFHHDGNPFGEAFGCSGTTTAVTSMASAAAGAEISRVGLERLL